MQNTNIFCLQLQEYKTAIEAAIFNANNITAEVTVLEVGDSKALNITAPGINKNILVIGIKKAFEGMGDIVVLIPGYFFNTRLGLWSEVV